MNLRISSVTVSQAAHPGQRVQFDLQTETGSVGVDLIITPPAEATLVQLQKLAAQAAIDKLSLLVR